MRAGRGILISVVSSVVTVLAVVAMLSSSGVALAQPPGTAGVAQSGPETGDGGAGSVKPGDAGPHPDWADEPLMPQISFSYYRLVGTAFNERTTTTTYAYNFNGCVYENGGTDNRFMAPVLVPEGATIKYLRLYYDDTNAGTDLTAWLTRYQPGVTSEDLTSVTSSGSSGYGTTLSPEITHTVDLTSWAYTVIIAPNANASSNSFCGVRVAYYAPVGTVGLMPSVLYNAHP